MEDYADGEKVGSNYETHKMILMCVFFVFSNFTAKDGDDFVAIVDLPEGEHQYKFLIDDEWKYNASEVC
jgi:hypothetical protein